MVNAMTEQDNNLLHKNYIFIASASKRDKWLVITNVLFSASIVVIEKALPWVGIGLPLSCEYKVN